ncbi:MAG: hypothetical protein ABL958_21980 [Bdellovibrionia bacterium]
MIRALLGLLLLVSMSDGAFGAVEKKNWDLNVGRSALRDSQGTWSGTNIGIQYNYSDKLGIMGNVNIAGDGNVGVRGREAADANVAGVVTPLRIHTKAGELSFSGLAGVTSIRTENAYPSPFEMGTVDGCSDLCYPQGRVLRAFVGLGTAFNFTDTFGVFARSDAILNAIEWGQHQLGLVFKF